MKLQLDMPGIIRVRDTTNYKGNSVTVVSIFDKDVAYYIGRPDEFYSSMDNEDWEDIFTRLVADFFGEMFVNAFPNNWSEENPTGRELSERDNLVILSETREGE